jgi:hypothetical protein
MIYQDGKGGNIMIKRFTVGGVTRDKEYVLTRGKEGSKVLWFTFNAAENNAESVRLMLRPKPKLRTTQIDVDFNQTEVKGRGAVGNILTKHAINRVIKLADAPVLPAPKQTSLLPEKVSGKSPERALAKAPAGGKKKAQKQAATPKAVPLSKKGSKASKKVSPLREDKAVTIEWEISGGSGQSVKERDRILTALEKKGKSKQRNQIKMDI